MNFVDLPLTGLRRVEPRLARDARGSFAKIYHRELFRQAGAAFEPAEQFFSSSAAGVLRGMHFQVPPADHAKLVCCLQGAILDVVLDLRRASPTYGRHVTAELSGENGYALFIPAGCAHGFLSRTDGALVSYLTSSVHDPVCDLGVRWDSFGFVWPCREPLVSERDRAFPAFAEWTSPF